MIGQFPPQNLPTSGSTAPSTTATMPAGFVAGFLAGAVPDGWYVLDGSITPSTTANPALYALLGDRFSAALDKLSLLASLAPIPPMKASRTWQNGFFVGAQIGITTDDNGYLAFDQNPATLWQPSSNSEGASLYINLQTPQHLCGFAIIAPYAATGGAAGDTPPLNFDINGDFPNANFAHNIVTVSAQRNLSPWGLGEQRTFFLPESSFAQASMSYQMMIQPGQSMAIAEFAPLFVADLQPFYRLPPPGQFGLPILNQPAAYAGMAAEIQLESITAAPFKGGVWAIKGG